MLFLYMATAWAFTGFSIPDTQVMACQSSMDVASSNYMFGLVRPPPAINYRDIGYQPQVHTVLSY